MPKSIVNNQARQPRLPSASNRGLNSANVPSANVAAVKNPLARKPGGK